MRTGDYWVEEGGGEGGLKVMGKVMLGKEVRGSMVLCLWGTLGKVCYSSVTQHMLSLRVSDPIPGTSN